MAKELTPATLWEEKPDGSIFTGCGKELVALASDVEDKAGGRNALGRGHVADGEDLRVVIQRGASALAPLGPLDVAVGTAVGVAKPGTVSEIKVRLRMYADAPIPVESVEEP